MNTNGIKLTPYSSLQKRKDKASNRGKRSVNKSHIREPETSQPTLSNMLMLEQSLTRAEMTSSTPASHNSRSYISTEGVSSDKSACNDCKTDRGSILAYWENYLAGISPCFFPQLSTEFASECSSAQYNSVDIPLPENFETHLSDTNPAITAPAIICVAWGLTLGAFTGLDSVCFGYKESGNEAPVTKIEETDESSFELRAFRVQLENELTVSEVLERAQDDYTRGLRYRDGGLADVLRYAEYAERELFNTCIFFSSGKAVEAANFKIKGKRFDAANLEKVSITLGLYPVATV